ncbi:MAG: ComEC/Rec2 family competence protein [Cyanobacteria bacterium J06588_4]
MTRISWIIIGLAYILGLLSTSLLTDAASGLALKQIAVLAGINIGLAIVGAIALRKIQARIWIVAAVVALLAAVYFQVRIPQPQDNDISYQTTQSDRPLVEVTGKVLTEPRLNSSQRLKFWLQATSMNNGESVSGKVYATLPLLQGTGIYPGQELDLTGFLYLPQSANNPRAFDFKQYLARQGIFAGIQGTEASFQSKPQSWGWSQLRQRIVRSHLQGLGSPVGQLVSSMVLGRKAVDLPFEIRDRFIAAGLAHVLAASGFHVSLLLGIVLKLTTRIAAKPRFTIGMGTLMIYLGLTGIQASVLRACLMGFAVLLALTLETKVRPLGSLLLAAAAILLFNPLLIDDLGFRLSFLATFGLIATLPKLQQQLDWLPTTIATIVAIPLAASVWVLPLLCYEFNTLATYSILTNILCTPLITIVSLGGMISGIIALILPPLGSAISSLLFYPATWLIEITKFFTSLPGSTWAVGQIPLGIVLAIYGLFILVWLNQWWQKRWWLGLVLPVILIVTITIHNGFQVQVTVLGTRQAPVIVLQDRGQAILINSGKNKQAKYRVLPFLAQQGINRLDYGLAYDRSNNSAAEWSTIIERVGVGKIFTSESDKVPLTKKTYTGTLPKITTKSLDITMDRDLNLFNIAIADYHWLILNPANNTNQEDLAAKIENYIQQENLAGQHLTIVFSQTIAPIWLELLQPELAIAPNSKITPAIKQILREKQIEFHDPVTEGMIRWTPQQGLRHTEQVLN